jgi:hypothetical protein
MLGKQNCCQLGRIVTPPIEIINSKEIAVTLREVVGSPPAVDG